ncbi:unnamed protein product [Boreogadus saida]
MTGPKLAHTLGEGPARHALGSPARILLLDEFLTLDIVATAGEGRHPAVAFPWTQLAAQPGSTTASAGQGCATAGPPTSTGHAPSRGEEESGKREETRALALANMGCLAIDNGAPAC